MEEEKLMKMKQKRKERDKEVLAGGISAPTHLNSAKVESTQSNWVDSANLKKRKKKSISKFSSIFQNPNFHYQIFNLTFSMPKF